MIDLRKLYARRLAAGAVRRSSLAVTPLEDRLQPAAPIQFFYVPMPEQETLAAIEHIGSGSQGSSMTSFITIAATENNTVITYDHWEDGYESNPSNPTQSKTEIWGDGNPNNGRTPGSPAGVDSPINAGSVIQLRNDVPALPRNAANFFFDGRDRIGADHTVTISRAQFPQDLGNGSTGSVISSAVEVRDTRFYAKNFTAPVGVDTDTVGGANNMFDHAQFFVMAAQDNTRVTVDPDGAGPLAATTAVINQGENLASVNTLKQGATVTSDKPVQVDLLTGDVGSGYASRSYALFADGQLYNDYYTPVGQVSGNNVDTPSVYVPDPVRLYVYNPNAADITVNYEQAGGATGSFTVAAGATNFLDVTSETGTRLFSTSNFAAVGAHDTHSTTHDWGFSLQPKTALSQLVVVGLGVGNSASPPSGSTSPIWVTAAQATTVYVDRNGNGVNDGGASGGVINGRAYDVSYPLDALDSIRVTDPTDNNASGMRLFTVDGTLLSTTWGEDFNAQTGAPGFDAGTVVPALGVPEFYKFVDFQRDGNGVAVGDANGDGLYNSGDTLVYTLRVRNIGTIGILNGTLQDALPTELTYVTNSTTRQLGTAAPTAVADDANPVTPFPLDEGGRTGVNVAADDTVTYRYTVTIKPNLPTGTTTVTNDGKFHFDIFNYPATVDVTVRGAVGDRVFRDANANGADDDGPGGTPGLGIAGVAVELVPDANGNGVVDGTEGNTVFTKTTDAAGRYQFTDLNEGKYVVRVAATNPTLAGLALSAGTTPRAITLGAGQVVTDADYGYRGTGTIGDRVFLDVNGSGGYDAGEGLDGVTVTLTGDVDGDGTNDTRTTTTTGDGFYQFANLRTTAGGVPYTVVVGAGLPVDVASSKNPTGGANGSNTISLTTGAATRDDQDFGYRGTGTIGDRVFLDVNTSGDYDAGEGIANATVTLVGDVDGDGTNESFTRTTDTDGFYTFAGLPVFQPDGTAVTYTTTVSGTPAGVTNTTDPDGTPDSTTTFNLTDDPTPDTIDFGYRGPGSIGDRVFADFNGNDVWDGGEGLDGVTVTLTGDLDGDGTPETVSTTTTGDGAYAFSGLRTTAGGVAYTVTVGGVPAGLASSSNPHGGANGSAPVSLSDAAPTADGVDFGYRGPGVVGDQLYVDANNDGDFDPGTDPVLAGVTVTLTGDLNGNGSVDPSETLSAVTDATGVYQFTGLRASAGGVSYTVAVTAGTLPKDGAGNPIANTVTPVTTFPLSAGSPTNTAVDFGYRGPGLLGDTVFLDVNGSGTPDAGEGLIGVAVDLSADLDGNGTREFFTTVTTDGTGSYTFTGLPVLTTAGQPVVFVVQPHVVGYANLTGTVVPAGATGVSLNPAAPTDRGQDFGYRGNQTIGDTVFLDLNGNGMPDAGEGLAGVRVTLTANLGSGTPQTFATRTDANGHYAFSGLVAPAGGTAIRYTVAVDPATLPRTGAGAAVTNTIDPNTAGNGDNTSFVDLDRTTAGNLNQDFGYRGPGSVGDRVFLDLNGNGRWDAGEGITGVTVTLSGDVDGDGTPDAFTTTTDADGFYRFAGLPVALANGTAIVYTVTAGTARLPAGVTNSADPDGTRDNTTSFTLSANPARTDIDFGYAGAGTLGDRVWVDADGNGLQGPSNAEPGLPGVGLTLTFAGQDGVFGTADDITTAATTMANGSYMFTNLPAGAYRVAVNPATLPGTPTVTADRDDTAPALDGVANVSLTVGQVRPDVDFGYTGTTTAGDRVFLDLNGNGQWDAGEGIAGVTVVLAGDLDGNGTAETFTAVTDDDGFYQFPGLPVTDRKGNTISYTATVNPADLPAGVNPSIDADGTADGSTTFTLAATPTRLDIDFGYAGTAAVGDRVWADANGDGLQGPVTAEPGLPGATVTLTFFGQDGTFGTPDDITTSVTTGATGAYTFGNLPAGSVRVAVDPTTAPAGTVAGPQDATLMMGESRSDVDFGLTGAGVVGDRVFLDLNGDGVYTPGEGIAGVTVTLTGGGLTFRTTTDADGFYQFPGLPTTSARGTPIVYTATVDPTNLPTGVAPSSDADGTADGGTTFTLTANPTRSDIDFGYQGTGTVGDRVWLDANGDGLQGPVAAEPGLSGVGLTLTYLGQDGVFGTADDITTTTTTGANGAYTFGHLPAGSVRVTVTPATLPGVALTADRDDTAPALDGSANLTLTAGQARTDADFGYRGPGSIGDRVFLDVNGDGVWNPGEGLANVTVTLTGGGLTFTTKTDGDGGYQFPGLPATEYTATVTPGTLTPAADLDGTPDNATTITLVGNPTRTDVDFGYTGPGRVGDRVFLDLNGDGVYTPGEGIAGVTVTLTGDVDGDGTPETFTVVTDADGGYTFARLPANDPTATPIAYTLTVDPANLPAGVRSTVDPDGTPNGTATFTLAGNPSRSDLNFGYAGTGTIGDRVWIDANGDGVQGDPTAEPGLPGGKLTLTYFGQDGVFGTADDITTSVTAGPDGSYTLANLPAGTFRVAVDPASLPGNVTATANPGTAVVLTPGQIRTDIDFGFQGAATIGKSVFVDANGNGRQDAGEPGIPGATVNLRWAGPDGVFGTPDDVTFRTTTDATGVYAFPGLPVIGADDPYRVTVTPPVGGLTPSGDPDGVPTPSVADLTVPANGPFDAANFGYGGSGTLSGTVYTDRNTNGRRDAGEPGLAGVVVRLSGTDVFGSPVVNPDTGRPYFEVTTDANGTYTFANVFPGTYTIVEVQPAGYTDGGEAAGTLGGTVTDDRIDGIPVGVGSTGGGYEFGENLPASIGGTVYRDDNANGVRNAGEPGLANVRVTLTGTDDRGTPVSITVVTDAAGNYAFGGLRPGTYRVSELQPAGFEQGQNTVGSAGGSLAAADSLDAIALGAGVAAVNYQFAETNPARPNAVAPLPPLVGRPAAATDLSKREFLASTPEATGAARTVGERTTPNFAALGSVNSTRPTQFLATGEGVGGSLVRVFDLSDGTERFRFEPFPGNPGGVRVATADVTGDGIPDVIAAAGPGGAPRVVVYDGNTGGVLQDFLAFEASFTGGLFVSAGDLDGDGRAELVISPDVGGGPRVRVLSGGDPTRVVGDLMGIDDSNFRGGARTAVGDVDGDGSPDVVVGAGMGGGPRIAVWGGRSILSGAATHLVADWFAFESTLRNGVYLSVGDVDGDGKADVLAGAGPGGAPRVVAFSAAGLLSGQPGLVANYFVGDTADRGGVPVAAVDLDGDGKVEVFSGAGEGSTPLARFTNPRTGQVIDEFAAEYLEFHGGIAVG